MLDSLWNDRQCRMLIFHPQYDEILLSHERGYLINSSPRLCRLSNFSLTVHTRVYLTANRLFDFTLLQQDKVFTALQFPLT